MVAENGRPPNGRQADRLQAHAHLFAYSPPCPPLDSPQAFSYPTEAQRKLEMQPNWRPNRYYDWRPEAASRQPAANQLASRRAS